MFLNILNPKQALNKAFLKQKPLRSQIDNFKSNLKVLLKKINKQESEDNVKNLVRDFLLDTYYKCEYEINTKDRNDLVIHNDKTAKSTVGVIIEAKRPTEKNDFPTKDNFNVKAMHELILYYLRERIDNNNTDLRNLVITNGFEWFIFDGKDFYNHFYSNTKLVKHYNEWKSGQKDSPKTKLFYNEIAKPFLEGNDNEITVTYLNIKDYENELSNYDLEDEKKLISLFKLFSPTHLLKVHFANDSNSLDKNFYGELLHIIGLEEVKEGSKKIIKRKVKPDNGSLIESAIFILEERDRLRIIENVSDYGNDKNSQLFNVALDLCITWVNRILFLKLLESQLLAYHQGNKKYCFLNIDTISSYDKLETLFFSVLAKKSEERHTRVKDSFSHIPYLNSSLFEPTETELALEISSLQDDNLEYYVYTVLKDVKDNRRKGNIYTLQYFFEFLDAYDFTSEGSEEIQEDSKTLINSSVLGLIFEKINGYKEGSFFTPGFITMYMSREIIRKTVIKKFNDNYGWNCKNIIDLYNKIEDSHEANQLINSIKICDPAVGSGHFLVSALNELIAIKSDLEILIDKDGKRLKNHHIIVENDELTVTDEDGDIFEYRKNNSESQRIQETLFREKELLIENCLFGVDVNPNSVKICRLRLWIELLKNSYYTAESNYAELETLPNIDINIKTGNSLISRFGLEDDLKSAFENSGYTLQDYKNAVKQYKCTNDRAKKQEILRIIDEIKTGFKSTIGVKFLGRLARARGSVQVLEEKIKNLQNFGEKINKKDKAALKKAKNNFVKIKTEHEELLKNVIYRNAFEWRFEFPEVLDDNGNFIGFDVVIGNPPYIFTRGNEFDSIKYYIWENYELNQGKINLYSVFLELGLNKILKNGYYLSYITPETFIRTSTYNEIRKSVLINQTIINLEIYGIGVFENVTAETITFFIRNQPCKESCIKVNVFDNEKNISKYEVKQSFFLTTPENRFIYNVSEIDNELFRKLFYNSTHLGQIVDVRNGVATKSGKYNYIANQKINNNYKKLLEAPEIFRYGYKWSGNYINYDKNVLHRPRKEETFLSEKILCQRVASKLVCCLDEEQYYTFNSINNMILINKDFPLKYLLGLLNSKLLNYYYVKMFSMDAGYTITVTKQNLDALPIKNINEGSELIVDKVNEILQTKKLNPEVGISFLEKQIDEMVYELYSLSKEEIKIVEKL